MTECRSIYNKRGTGTISGTGHRNIQKNGRKRGEHVWICEGILGRPLPKGVEIHHVNNQPADNRHENLVICPDRAYHKLLHRRTAAYDACGHADWNKCTHCKVWGPPSAVLIKRNRESLVKTFHRECELSYRRTYYRSKHPLVGDS